MAMLSLYLSVYKLDLHGDIQPIISNVMIAGWIWLLFGANSCKHVIHGAWGIG